MSGGQSFARALGGVEVIDVPVSDHLAPFVLDKHGVHMLQPQNDTGRWLPRQAAFLPELTDFAPPDPGAQTLVMLEHGLFTRAAADHIDLDRVPFVASEISDPLTLGLAQTIRSLVLADDASRWPLMAESAALSLAIAVVRSLAPDASRAFDSIRSSPCAKRVKRVQEYIDDNLGRPITLDELAAVAARSKFHFARTFREAFGMSPVRYLASRRVDEAKKLLRGSTMSLAEIAVACGFASQSHMTTVFRKVLSTTPGLYRRGATGAAVAWLAGVAADWLDPLTDLLQLI